MREVRTGAAWLCLLALLAAGCAGGATPPGVDASTDSPSASPSTGVDVEPSTNPSAAAPPQVSAAPNTVAEFPPYASNILTVTAERLGASYRSGCPLVPEGLRLLRLSYVTFDGLSATGELVVAADVAEDFVAIFAALYEMRFPIRSLTTVEAFGANDDTSMAYDNTSAFNCRPVTGGSGWSLHSYGVAVDINPRENPYLSGDSVLPPEGRNYLDRSHPVPGMIVAGDAVVILFESHGFDWGGYWTRPVDYQHFEKD